MSTKSSTGLLRQAITRSQKNRSNNVEKERVPSPMADCFSCEQASVCKSQNGTCPDRFHSNK